MQFDSLGVYIQNTLNMQRLHIKTWNNVPVPSPEQYFGGEHALPLVPEVKQRMFQRPW